MKSEQSQRQIMDYRKEQVMAVAAPPPMNDPFYAPVVLKEGEVDPLDAFMQNLDGPDKKKKSKKKDKQDAQTIDDVRQGYGAGAYEALKPKNAMLKKKLTILTQF